MENTYEAENAASQAASMLGSLGIQGMRESPGALIRATKDRFDATFSRDGVSECGVSLRFVNGHRKVDGNDVLLPKVSVSWRAHGQLDVLQARAALDLYGEVARAATMIQAFLDSMTIVDVPWELE